MLAINSSKDSPSLYAGAWGMKILGMNGELPLYTVGSP